MESLEIKDQIDINENGFDFIHSGIANSKFIPGSPYTTFCGKVRLARGDLFERKNPNFEHVTCPECLIVIRFLGRKS